MGKFLFEKSMDSILGQSSFLDYPICGYIIVHSSSVLWEGRSSVCLFARSVSAVAVGYLSGRSCLFPLQSGLLESTPTNAAESSAVNVAGILQLSWGLLRSLVAMAAGLLCTSGHWRPQWHHYMAYTDSLYPSFLFLAISRCLSCLCSDPFIAPLCCQRSLLDSSHIHPPRAVFICP